MPNTWEDWLVQHGINPDELEYGATIDLPDSLIMGDNRDNPPAVKRGSNNARLNEYEQRFLHYWRVYGDNSFAITPQFHFHPSRNWRCDFCFVEQKVIVEINGMGGTGGHPGSHRGIVGYMSDCEKELEAAALGYQTVRVPTTWLHQSAGKFNIKNAISLINTVLRYR